MLLECGIINYKIIIPIIYPIFYQIRRLIHKDEEKPFLKFFVNYLGYLFSGLIYLFIKWRMKKKIPMSDKNINNKETNIVILELNDELIPDSDDNNVVKSQKVKSLKEIKKENIQIDLNKEKKKMKKKYLFIFLLVIIYLIPVLLDAFNQYDVKTSSSVSLLFTIISYVILGRLILGMKIYLHQIFSSIINLISCIAIILLVFIGEKHENLFLSLLFIFAIVVMYCLFNNLVKKYFNTFMGSPYYIMFIIGLMSICLILPYEIITVLAFGKDTKFNGIFYQMEKNFEKNKLYPLIFIADILTAFFLIAGIILTIYFFTPCHFIISESISQIISTFIGQNLKELSTTRQVFIYILFFIIFLGSLIYNEIFIINICSLSKNTQKYIIKRQKEETDDIIDDINYG